MALSKPAFFAHLKTLANHRHRFLPSPPSTVSLRFLSFSSSEEAAAERRRRKRRLRIEPPVFSLNRSQKQQQQNAEEQEQIPPPVQNPNAPKLPEHVSAVSGNRLNLHNKILTLIHENNLEEAALYTRHSVYSNCRPTIYTVNAVLNAQLRQSKYSDLLSLHRFIIQAGIAPNIITHNLIFQTYLDCRRPDTALEHYKQFINDAPFNPSPTTYRIMMKGLVDNGKLEKALELKEQMIELKGFSPDPLVYHYLMLGYVRNSDPDGVFKLFEEFKEKMGGGAVEDGVIYACLMKGYFLRDMEKEAMQCYEEALGENSKIKMNVVAYNSVLDALCKNGKFDEALKLFERMVKEHNLPKILALDLGSFNVMVDGYCLQGRFEEAIQFFGSMGEYKCHPDTLSFNNLIDQLCKNGLLAEADLVYGEMDGKGVKPDECTYVLLMDTCLKENRVDDGAAYYRKMVEAGSRPNLAVYNRLVDELVKVGKIDEAKSVYDLMVKKLKMNSESYKFMMRAMSDAGKLDEVLKMVGEILDDESADFDEELQEFVKGELSKEGREEELPRLMAEKERQKAEAKAAEREAVEAAKRKLRADVANLSLPPSKLYGNKEAEAQPEGAIDSAVEASSADGGALAENEERVEEATLAESTSMDTNLEEVMKEESSDELEARNT